MANSTDNKAAASLLPPLGAQAASVYDSLVQQTASVLQQAGFDQLALGLSGGLDSAVVATIATDALALLGGASSNVQGIIMPSQWTSAASITDAQDVASRLEISSQVLDIMPAYGAITDTLQPAFALSPQQQPDVTAENIQARIRAVLLMALANKFNYLVLATSNLSEISVGYTTLYGDMVGAFAPLAPLYKTWVFELAHFRNQRATAAGKTAPVPSSILEKAPSAELSPGQTDQAELGPYNQLDGLLYLLHGGVRPQDGDFDADYVAKISAMMQRAAYKRQQACPGAVLPAEIAICD
ncbi:MAG: NAD(+) synthase [Coriobacteriia bacterium]|nr:NAD(+) synthase [Coriobacteriia bacterium]